MSTSETLSQEEVDTLLYEDKSQGRNDNITSQNFDSFDFNSNTRKTIESIAGLETIHAVFAREASLAGTHFLCQKTLIEPNHPEILTFKEFIGKISRPVLINYVKIPAIDSQILITFTGKFVANLIEGLFGGNISENTDNNREFGTFEMRLGRLFVDILNRSMSKAWENTKSGFKFEYEKTVLNPSLVNVAEAKESVIVNKFECIMNQVRHDFSILYPKSTILSLKKLLKHSCHISNSKEDQFWHEAIVKNIEAVPIDLQAKSIEIAMNLHDLMKIKVGDIIPIENPNYAYLKINEVDVFFGKCTNSSGKRAIVVENRLLE